MLMRMWRKGTLIVGVNANQCSCSLSSSSSFFLLEISPQNFKHFLGGVQTINNMVVMSGERQKGSAIHIHVSIVLQTPSHPGWHITLSRVPCAIQQVLVGYPFSIQQCVTYTAFYMSIIPQQWFKEKTITLNNTSDRTDFW